VVRPAPAIDERAALDMQPRDAPRLRRRIAWEACECVKRGLAQAFLL
jgi:hypothetical protein